MQFYAKLKNIKPKEEKIYPHIYFVQDDWDDYGLKQLFSVWFYANANSNTKLGTVKIMSLDPGKYTEKGYLLIPTDFTELDDIYCSLGQETSYYSNFAKVINLGHEDVLGLINDVVSSPGIIESFEDDSGFKDSLIRYSEAERALKIGNSLLNEQEFTIDYKFNFSCLINGASRNHSAEFTFNKDSILPSRINAVIGANGTGKTQYLAKLALAISGEEDSGEFNPHRPLFNKVIALSYSAFDKFKRPKSKRSFSYKYCGLRDSNGFITSKKLENNYKHSCDKIEKKNREIIWHKVLSNIIDEDVLNGISKDFFLIKSYAKVAQNTDGLLSSGQSILLYVLTEVIANIRENSLILFDEPEMHLHPNAVSKLVIMLNQILSKFDSYSIIATHSPIILQEIPSKNVSIFEREGNTPNVRELDIESFGENINTITKSVFETINTTQNYKEVLKELANEYSFEEVCKLFDDRLSLNAEIYLKGCYRVEEPK